MFIKKQHNWGLLKNTILNGGRESRKKQYIAVLPKWGEYRQFADLRGSWQKRGAGVFEG